MNNLSAIDQLLSIPPSLGNKSEKIWRDIFHTAQPILMIRRQGSFLHQRGLLVELVYILLQFPLFMFRSYLPERFIPSYGALAESESRQLNPRLWQLVLNNDVPQVRAMLQKSPKLLRSMHRGLSVTHYAALENKPDVLRFLIKLNADTVHWRDSLQRTPLIFAIRSGSLECVQILVDAGSDLSIRAYPEKRTPLSIAYTSAMPYYGKIPPMDVGPGSDRRRILKVLRDKGDFNNDNKSEYATWYIFVEYWVILSREVVRILSSYLCLMLLLAQFVYLRRLGVVMTVAIFANLLPAVYKTACEVLLLVAFFTALASWRRVVLVFLIFSCGAALEAAAGKISENQQMLEVNSRVSDISIPLGIIIARDAPPSKINSIWAISLALGIPKLRHFHRNQSKESRYQAKQILSLFFRLSADLLWIFCPEAMVGFMLFMLIHHAYGGTDMDRKPAWDESNEVWRGAKSSEFERQPKEAGSATLVENRN